MKAGHYAYFARSELAAKAAQGWKPVSDLGSRVLMTKPFGWQERERYYWERPAPFGGEGYKVFDRRRGTGDYGTSRHIAVCTDADTANAIVEALNERELR